METGKWSTEQRRVLGRCRRALVALTAVPQAVPIKLLTANNRTTGRTPQLLLSLGDAYAAKGSIPEALDAYKRCQELVGVEKTSDLRQGTNELSRRIAALTSQ